MKKKIQTQIIKLYNFFLLIEKIEFVKSFFSSSFNINKADWKLFKENLKKEEEKILNNIQPLLQNSQKLNIERAVVRLKKLLLKVTQDNISLRRKFLQIKV